MLKRRIIPCLDIKNGRVVKGVHFAGLRDTGDPVEAARAYDVQGADEICLLDITATVEGRETFIDCVRRVGFDTFKDGANSARLADKHEELHAMPKTSGYAKDAQEA